MTAVVGLLNKRGVAIAADSAVTRRKGLNEKVTKNGSKMLRLSNVVPVSVMLTGNGAFIWNQWDLVIRHYRKHRGDVKHATVEDCMHDFFAHIASCPIFWHDGYMKRWIRHNFERTFDRAFQRIDWETKRTNDEGEFVRPKGVLSAFIKELKNGTKRFTDSGRCPQFEDYTIDQFKEYTKNVFDDYIKDITTEDENHPSKTIYPKDFVEAITEDLLLATMERMTCRNQGDSCAILVFSGFGSEQEYPSLVSACVCEGFDHRVNYHVRPKDVICISDENPVAFCPFAQSDITRGLIREIHKDFGENISRATKSFYMDAAFDIFPEKEDDLNFRNLLLDVKHEDLTKKLTKDVVRLFDKNQREWEKAFKDYDLKSMAALAQSLIDLTGFHRILTFEQEGVGGPVDVAVITKNDGFTWLSRKSWYHHKDVNGMYGSMGI